MEPRALEGYLGLTVFQTLCPLATHLALGGCLPYPLLVRILESEPMLSRTRCFGSWAVGLTAGLSPWVHRSVGTCVSLSPILLGPGWQGWGLAGGQPCLVECG